MIDDRNLRKPAALDLRLRVLEHLVGQLLGANCREALHAAFSETFSECGWPDEGRLRAEVLHHLEHRYGLHPPRDFP